MDLSAIRDGLKTRLATITSLANRCHDVWPDSVNVPAALVKPVSLEFHESFGDATVGTFEVVLLAAALDQGFARGQDTLDAYLNETGTSSVKAAIEGDKTLGGTVDDCTVLRWHDYGQIVVNGVSYLGVIFDVEVIT